MKYPVDVEAWIAEFNAQYPENDYGERLFGVVLPMVNEAYYAGLAAGREETHEV